MLKNKFFFTILIAIIIILTVFVFYYDSLDVNYVKKGGRIVEKLEQDVNSYYSKLNNSKEKENIESEIKKYIVKENEISSDFIYRFYLVRSNYFMSKNQFREAIEDLNKVIINSNGLEKDIAYLNRGVIYEKLDKRDQAILSYDEAIKYTKLDFIKIRALFYKASLVEKKDKHQSKILYEKIVNFPYKNNLYIGIANNKLLELKSK